MEMCVGGVVVLQEGKGDEVVVEGESSKRVNAASLLARLSFEIRLVVRGWNVYERHGFRLKGERDDFTRGVGLGRGVWPEVTLWMESDWKV